MLFKNYIKKCRILCGYTQRAMSYNIGVNISTYKSWEQGKCLPSINNIKKIKDMIINKGYKNEAEELYNLYIENKTNLNKADINNKDVRRYIL